MGGEVLEPELFPGCPDDDCVLVKFSSQCCVEHRHCLCDSQLQTTPGAAVVTRSMAVTIRLVCRPPWQLKDGGVSSLSSPGLFVLCILRTAISAVHVVLWWESQTSVSLVSSCCHFPQLPSRDPQDHARWTDVMAPSQTAAILAETPHSVL